MRVRPLGNIDHASRLALAGVVILTIVSIGAMLLIGSSRPPANTSSPAGAVTTYVLAIQAGDANRAWAVLAQAANQSAAGGAPRPILSQDDFRNQVEASHQPTSPRVRIVNSHQSSDTASIELEVSHPSVNPLTGTSTQQLTLDLARQAAGWRITSDSQPWQFQ